jgi:hypothetical protein
LLEQGWLEQKLLHPRGIGHFVPRKKKKNGSFMPLCIPYWKIPKDSKKGKVGCLPGRFETMTKTVLRIKKRLFWTFKIVVKHGVNFFKKTNREINQQRKASSLLTFRVEVLISVE